VTQLLSNPRLRYLADSIRKELEWLPKDLRFRFEHRSDRMPPVPPPYLRFRVAGDYGVKWFHESGRESRNAFESALSGVGKTLQDFRSILDFGVGCGRVARWMEDLVPRARLYGVDIDPPAIRWCKRHIRYATVTRTSPLPPLPFASGTFDLVYSHSVFTHLNEAYQDEWLAELARVTRPGALLLLTVAGETPFRQFFQSNPTHPGMLEYAKRRDHDGVLFVSDDNWTGIFPDFYHSAFHTRAYVERHWSRFFTVRAHLETAMLGLQDIVVLERPA